MSSRLMNIALYSDPDSWKLLYTDGDIWTKTLQTDGYTLKINGVYAPYRWRYLDKRSRLMEISGQTLQIDGDIWTNAPD